MPRKEELELSDSSRTASVDWERDELLHKESYGDGYEQSASGAYRRRPTSMYNHALDRRRRIVAAVCIVFAAVFFAAYFLRAHYSVMPDLSSMPEAFRFCHASESVAAGISAGSSSSEPLRNGFFYSDGSRFKKPENMQIVAIIFFGRRQFVDILDCYLRRNLAINGGLLDQVHFVIHTTEEEDVKWLEELVAQSGLEGHYLLKGEKHDAGWNLWRAFDTLWRDYMTDPNTIYIKIDDDVTFIDDIAIPELIKATLEHPEAHSIVSNNINNRWNYWHHYHAGAVWPYLPDTNEQSTWSPDSWRPSELPHYSGAMPPLTQDFTRNFTPPFDGHRWLPLDTSYGVARVMPYTPSGPWLPTPDIHTDETAVGWSMATNRPQWQLTVHNVRLVLISIMIQAVAAQSHYSFFENYERGRLAKYDFGDREQGIWNLWYTRWNINLMAIRGTNVNLVPFWDGRYKELDKGDEYLLTMVIPKDVEMPVLVATRAIAAHFSFHADREALLKTDILDRYRALANEKVCSIDNQKARLDFPAAPAP